MLNVIAIPSITSFILEKFLLSAQLFRIYERPPTLISTHQINDSHANGLSKGYFSGTYKLIGGHLVIIQDRGGGGAWRDREGVNLLSPATKFHLS